MRRSRKQVSYRRASVEQCQAALKRRLRRETKLRDEEAVALLKALNGEALTERESSLAGRAARMVLAGDRKQARDVLATYRGDRRVPDEPLVRVYADDILQEMGSEGLIPELADSGAEYVTTDRGVVHPRLVNAEDLLADTRRGLGTLVSL